MPLAVLVSEVGAKNRIQLVIRILAGTRVVHPLVLEAGLHTIGSSSPRFGLA